MLAFPGRLCYTCLLYTSGKALLGAQEGDEVDVEAPRGTITYIVKKIEH